MSPQEIGVYTMLLCRMYEESGPVEYHVLRLSTYCGMREKTFVAVAEKLVALGKITMRDGMIFNDRAAIEISDRADKLKNNSKAGKASAEKRQSNQCEDATDVQRPFNHTDTDTDTEKKEPPNPQWGNGKKKGFVRSPRAKEPTKYERHQAAMAEAMKILEARDAERSLNAKHT